jgi:hypothetical protein
MGGINSVASQKNLIFYQLKFLKRKQKSCKLLKTEVEVYWTGDDTCTYTEGT